MQDDPPEREDLNEKWGRIYLDILSACGKLVTVSGGIEFDSYENSVDLSEFDCDPDHSQAALLIGDDPPEDEFEAKRQIVWLDFDDQESVDEVECKWDKIYDDICLECLEFEAIDDSVDFSENDRDLNHPQAAQIWRDDPPEDTEDEFDGMLDDAPTTPPNMYGEE